MRPVLAPAARRLWRDAGTLQLGLPSSRAVVVEGLGPHGRALLGLLDGVRTREQVVTEAVLRGFGDPEPLLRELEQAGLLLDADALGHPGLDRDTRDRLAPDLAALALVRGSRVAEAFAARQAARVVVHGAGRVGATVASLLHEAGVGSVDVRDSAVTRPADLGVGGLGPQDLGRPRAEALSHRLRSVPSAQRPAVVVLTEEAAPDVLRVLLRDGVPHLPAQVEGHVGTIGPLVLPGRSACLRCVDLVRTALDPGWPAVLAQRGPGTATGSGDGVLAVAVAAQAAAQVLALLEGDQPASVGGTLELEQPDWRWRRRTWPQHPGCSCHELAEGPVLLAS